LLEEFGMEVMLNLDEATPSELRIAEVETKRDSNQQAIDQITEINKEVLNEHLVKPTRLVTMAKDYIRNTEQSIKLEVAAKICDGELDLEKMQLNRLDVILKYYNLWKDYRDNMELQKTS
jgi:hypothetical protein